MGLLIIKIFLLLLSESALQKGAHNTQIDIEKEQFKMIDISKDNIIKMILGDATQSNNSFDTTCYYTLRYGKLNNGTLLKISEYNDSVLTHDMYFSGYIPFEGRNILVLTDSSYQFELANPAISITVPRRKEKQSTHSKETNELYYFIMDDIYAKLDPNRGWIWSDGKPDVDYRH